MYYSRRTSSSVVAKASAAANALLSCSLLTFCSISMVLANKMLSGSYDVNLKVLLLAFQCFVAAILVEVSRLFGIVEYEPFQLKMALRWLPIVSLFCAMLFTSFMALGNLTVPMVTAFKSMANVLIVFGDWWLNDQPISFLIMTSIAIMVGGAFLAGREDLSFSLVGYLWMGGNVFCTASYVLSMKAATKYIPLPKFGMVFYNNLLGACILLPVAFLKGEVEVFMKNESLHTLNFALLNTFAGGVGFFLNFAALWCVASTSATTYAVVNTVNNFPLAIIGALVFRSKIPTSQWTYIVLNMFGGMIYCYAKIKEKKNAKAKGGEVKVIPTERTLDKEESAIPLMTMEKRVETGLI